MNFRTRACFIISISITLRRATHLPGPLSLASLLPAALPSPPTPHTHAQTKFKTLSSFSFELKIRRSGKVGVLAPFLHMAQVCCVHMRSSPIVWPREMVHDDSVVCCDASFFCDIIG